MVARGLDSHSAHGRRARLHPSLLRRLQEPGVSLLGCERTPIHQLRTRAGLCPPPPHGPERERSHRGYSRRDSPSTARTRRRSRAVPRQGYPLCSDRSAESASGVARGDSCRASHRSAREREPMDTCARSRSTRPPRHQRVLASFVRPRQRRTLASPSRSRRFVGTPGGRARRSALANDGGRAGSSGSSARVESAHDARSGRCGHRPHSAFDSGRRVRAAGRRARPRCAQCARRCLARQTGLPRRELRRASRQSRAPRRTRRAGRGRS